MADMYFITDWQTYWAAVDNWLKTLRLKAGISSQQERIIREGIRASAASGAALEQMPYYSTLTSMDDIDRELEIKDTKAFVSMTNSLYEAIGDEAASLQRQIWSDYVSGGVTWDTWAQMSRLMKTGQFAHVLNKEDILEWYRKQAEKTQARDYKTMYEHALAEQANANAEYQRELDDALKTLEDIEYEYEVQRLL